MKSIKRPEQRVNHHSFFKGGKLKSIIVDFEKNILKIDGVDITTPTVVNIPATEGWAVAEGFENQKLFNDDIELLEKGGKPDVLDIKYTKMPNKLSFNEEVLKNYMKSVTDNKGRKFETLENLVLDFQNETLIINEEKIAEPTIVELTGNDMWGFTKIFNHKLFAPGMKMHQITINIEFDALPKE